MTQGFVAYTRRAMTTTWEQIDRWRQAASEHQHLEFKEAKQDFNKDNLYRYCVGMANEGGGQLLLGIADKPPRPVVGTKAFPNLVAITDDLFQKLKFRVDVEEVAHTHRGGSSCFTSPPGRTGLPMRWMGLF